MLYREGSSVHLKTNYYDILQINQSIYNTHIHFYELKWNVSAEVRTQWGCHRYVDSVTTTLLRLIYWRWSKQTGHTGNTKWKPFSSSVVCHMNVPPRD